MERLFTMPDAWSGGSFELLMFLGSHDNEHVRQVLVRLWSHPSLRGCWLDRDREPSQQSPVSPQDWHRESANALLGIATLPNRSECACSSVVVTDEHGYWLYFGTPLGSLGTCYDIGAYPFEDASDPSWIGPVSDWLAQLALHIFARIPFEAGITGWLTTLEEEEPLRIITQAIPAERWNGYLRREGDHLAWYPPNISAAPMSIEGDP